MPVGPIDADVMSAEVRCSEKTLEIYYVNSDIRTAVCSELPCTHY